MGRPTLLESKDTRTDLLRVALELLQTRGYNAFSYQDLADRLDIRKASIHYYFPTKEDLGIGLMESSIARLQAWQEKNSDQDISPLTRLESYFDYFAGVSDNGRKICPCGSFSAEWDSLPEKVQAAVTRLLGLHREWLKGVLEAGRKNGEIVKIGTVEEQAQFIYAGVQGALQTSRMQNMPGYYRAVTRQILNSLKVAH